MCDPDRMPERPRRGFTGTAALLGTAAVVLAGLAGIGWLIFRHHRHRPPQLAAATRRLVGAQVVVKADGSGFTATTAELGLVVDAPASTRYLRYKADERAVFAIVAARDRSRTAPVEPLVKAKRDGSGFVVIAGKPGHGIDPRELLHALTKARTTGPGRLTASVGRGTVPPRVSLAEAEAVAAQADAITARAVVVSAGSTTARVQPATLRPWIHSEPSPDGIHLTIDPKLALDGLGRLPAKATVPATKGHFVLSAAGQPQVLPGTPGQTCCADAAPGLVLQTVLDRARGTTGPTVTLPLRPLAPKLTADRIPSLGVKELVSTFTTKYVAGQPRVT